MCYHDYLDWLHYASTKKSCNKAKSECNYIDASTMLRTPHKPFHAMIYRAMPHFAMHTCLLREPKAG